jgi:hypothetical protein
VPVARLITVNRGAGRVSNVSADACKRSCVVATTGERRIETFSSIGVRRRSADDADDVDDADDIGGQIFSTYIEGRPEDGG